LDVTFQVFPDFDPDENLVHGWKGDDLHFLLLVDEQPGGHKTDKYWRGMLEEIRNGSDDKSVTVLSEGAYSGASAKQISYKLLSWVSDGDTTIQMYNLINGKRRSYWVISTPFSEDLDYMLEETKKLLASSTLLE
jgi:CDP-glycerol glycerophosphotransferase (TagB/SpsB family)